MLRITFAVLSILTLSLNTFAQSTCDQLIKLKLEYYGFKPNSLNQKQTEAKSAQLDKFWELATKDPEKALPCLRDLISSENNDPYFCFDAATLILTLDKNKQYIDAVLEGARKCDLSQLQAEPFLRVSYFLAKNNKDISDLTTKLISTPNVKVFLVQHAITLNAIDASLYLYNTMAIAEAEDNLFNILKAGTPIGRQNAAVVLNILSTVRGDSLLNSLIAQGQLPDSTKKFILNDRENLIKQAKTDMHGKDENTIRAERTASITGLSDESLHRYFSLTGALMVARKVE